MPPIEPGDYQLVAEATGFALSTVTGIRIEVGQERTIAVKLQAAQVATNLVVEASAPELITDRPDRGNVIESKFRRECPPQRPQSAPTYQLRARRCAKQFELQRYQRAQREPHQLVPH